MYVMLLTAFDGQEQFERITLSKEARPVKPDQLKGHMINGNNVIQTDKGKLNITRTFLLPLTLFVVPACHLASIRWA